jgi:hypothetical protein
MNDTTGKHTSIFHADGNARSVLIDQVKFMSKLFADISYGSN